MNRRDLEDARNVINDAESLMNDLINLLNVGGRADTGDIIYAVEALIQEKVDLAERLDAILDERDGLVVQIDELIERLNDNEQEMK